MAIDVGRRQLISILSGAAVTWPLSARAQQAAKLPTIGVLGSTTPLLWSEWTAAFLQRLRDLGWIEGRNVAIEYRWAEGRNERAVEIAAEFVRLKVDVIVTAGAANVIATKQATSVIPIVFALAPDPVVDGLVASLARPGGNVTGLSVQSTDSVGKRLEFLREVLPGLHRIGILANVGDPGVMREAGEIQTAVGTLDLEFSTLKIRRVEDIAPAIDALKGNVDALYVVGDPLTTGDQVRINALALAARLPTMWPDGANTKAGGLMSYGPSFPDLFRRAGDIVDKILRGTKPVDIPVEQPTKFDLVVNLITAKALGLQIPHNVLVVADEVIE
jgi:putative tryptophan/tyrosine transport system substrate-binding protein